jgi:hypothetical protein
MILLAVLYFVFGLIVGALVVSFIFMSFMAHGAVGILVWVIRHLRLARFKGTPLEEIIADMETTKRRLELVGRGKSP